MLGLVVSLCVAANTAGVYRCPHTGARCPGGQCLSCTRPLEPTANAQPYDYRIAFDYPWGRPAVRPALMPPIEPYEQIEPGVPAMPEPPQAQTLLKRRSAEPGSVRVRRIAVKQRRGPTPPELPLPDPSLPFPEVARRPGTHIER